MPQNICLYMYKDKQEATMIEQISTKSVPNGFVASQNEQNQQFAANIQATPNDSFESTTKPQIVEKKTFFGWFDAVCVAAAGGSLFMWRKSHTNLTAVGKKLSSTFEAIGEKMPESIQNAAERLHDFSTKDAMSGLNNRATFDAALAKTVKEAAESKSDLHMAMLDMDFFKSINEILGHTKGDKFIKHLSRIIKEVSTEHNVSAYRVGGEEMAVLMPGHNQESAQKIAQKIADKIKADTQIQGHKDEFLKKAEERLATFRQEQQPYDNLWKSIRSADADQSQVARNVLEFLGDNPSSKTDEDKNLLKEAIKQLEEIRDGKSSKRVKDLIDSHHPVVARALNQKNNRTSEIDSITNWIRHVSKHGFTISAGVAGRKSDVPEELLKRTNSALEVQAKHSRNMVAVAKD